MKKYKTYEFPDCKNVVICGDIHGNFPQLLYKMDEYGIKDTVLIVAGDCGFGFSSKYYYKSSFGQWANRLKAANNWILFVRGNHDNPAYFSGKVLKYKRTILIPDYSIVKANGNTILCIGGAVSIDRGSRLMSLKRQKQFDEMLNIPSDETDVFRYGLYWADEMPTYDEQLLDKILSENIVDTVITHTAPSFCELLTTDGIKDWFRYDATLEADLKTERSIMDSIHAKIKDTAVINWFYGHFHQSWESEINGIFFKMLNIMEFTDLKNKFTIGI